MSDGFLKDEKFVEMMNLHVRDVLGLLLEKGEDFFILANLQEVGFEPSLPRDISDNFDPIISFNICNYAKESARLEDDIFSFETGFGSENIGSVVSVGLKDIIQISLERAVLLVNTSIPTKEKEDIGGLDKSMEAMLSNPKNQKFFK